MKNFVFMSLILSFNLAHAKDLIGTTKLARHYTDKDLIYLENPVCGISKLKLVVKNRAAEIDEIAVQFAATRAWDHLKVRQNFARGSQSRWIELNGRRRCIKRIAIVGTSQGRPGRRARVEIYGK